MRRVEEREGGQNISAWKMGGQNNFDRLWEGQNSSDAQGKTVHNQQNVSKFNIFNADPFKVNGVLKNELRLSTCSTHEFKCWLVLVLLAWWANSHEMVTNKVTF